MAKPRDDISFEQVWRALSYDPETGIFTWKRRADVPTWWNARFAETRAGTIGQNGYVYITLFAKHYLAQRLAFLLMKRRWPKGKVDHKNRARPDNRWENLREATGSQNNANNEQRTKSSSGYRGVRWHRASETWQARITVDGKEHSLRYHQTKEDAARAYNAAAIHYFGEFAKLNVIPRREGV